MVNRSGPESALARVRGLVLLAILFAGAGLLLKHDFVSSSHSASSATTQVEASLARLPMSFEPNRGQADSPVKFLAHGAGYGVYLLPTEAVLMLPERTREGLEQAGVEMQLAGANRNATLAGVDQLAGHSSYFIGNNASRWLKNVPQFGRVQYRDVYPGVNLAFYGNQGRLEYDFEVAPGRDPQQIELNFKGASGVSLAANGDLVLKIRDRELRFEAPHVYQKSAAGTQTVAASFALRGHDSAGFEIGPYDRSRTLVIDPVLTFSSYVGGSGAESCTAITGATLGFIPHCPAIAIDSSNQRVYIAGSTTTPSTGTFSGATPILVGAMATADVYVARISLGSTGGVTTATLDHVTYLGGSSGVQYPVGVGVDGGFNMYVAGTTNAADFPTTSSAFQATAASSGNHAFVTKIDPTGSVNMYSSYLSGNGVETASNMAIDTLGKIYVIGTTTSTNYPTTVGAIQPNSLANNQFFFSKINPAQNTINSLQYSTYIGGSTPTNGVVMGGGVAVDAAFNVYLAGGTNFTDMGSPNPWILNAYQATAPVGINAWVARLNAPANNTQQYSISYATYLGGGGDDVAYGVASDGTNTYITGSTTSTDIVVPTTTLSFQNTNSGAIDAFVAKLGVPAVTGTTQGTVPLDYFSYLGGGAQDVGLAVLPDSLGNARVIGFTDSADFHTASPFQASSGGGRDAFIARLNTTGTSTSANTSTSSYFGGSGTDIGTSVALDSFLNTYLGGETSSGNFPIANPLSGSGSLAGASDAFVSELGPNTGGLSMPQVTDASALPACKAANPTVSPTPAGVGSPITFTYYIYNTGDPVANVVFTDSLGVNSGSTSASASQGSCQTAVTTGTLSCTLGTVNSSTVTTLTTANGCGAMTSTNFAAKVTVTVNAPNTALQGSGSIGNTANLSFPGGSLPSISGTATVNDYTVSSGLAAPSTSTTIPSGGAVNFALTVTPTGAGFPESVTLACGTGLPAGATCAFPNSDNVISSMSNGAQSRVLAIQTTARVTTTAGLFGRGPLFAIWFPIMGMGLIGAGVSRKRRLLLGIFFTVVVAMALLQAGCSSRTTTTTTTGTPAGTYTIPVNATSGSAVRTTTVQFTVE